MCVCVCKKLSALLLAFLLPLVVFAQNNVTVSGTILDEQDMPVVGATVAVVGQTNKGALSDLDGHFSITGIPANSTLRISYVGYKTQEIALAGQTSLNIKLIPDSEILDELVVVGFGSQRKADVTGAVTQVKMSDVLGDRPIVSSSAALQGAIPGLMVSGGSGPGQMKNFNIRGTLSINGGGPLVLIDNVEGNIDDLNPNDIESITVLKDAASSAIYGARAAGGVILVTTKRPKGGTKFQLNYSFNQGWENAIARPVQASLMDYIAAYEEAGYSTQYWAGDGNLETWKELLGQYRAGTLEGVGDNGIYRHTDNKVYYLKEGDPTGNALTTGIMTNHNVSVTGDTDRLRFRLSGNYSYEDGPLYTSKDNYRRYVLNSFVSADITKWFTQEATIIYTNTQSQSLTGSIRDVYATRLVSWYPEGYMPKEIIGTEEDLIIDSPRNALEIANTANTTVSKPRIQLKTIIKPLEGWSITGEYTFLSTNTINRGYTGVTRYADVQLAVKTQPSDPTKDQYWILNRENKYHALNLYSNYDFEIGKHKVGLMAGFNQERSYFGEVKGTIEGQSVPTVPSFGGGTGEKYLSDGYSEFAIRGAFGRLTYNYDNRYLLNLNARYDGSSKFPKSNRFGFFPSVSLGWRIANESFMDWSDSWLDDFKIRASYGEIGNQSIAPYGFVPQMTIGQSNVWIDRDGRITYINSPDLVRANYTWERVSTLDVGYDLTAFSGRLNSTFSWYLRNTLGMLAPGAEIPAVIGASAPQQNVADLSTKGWELSVNWRDIIGDFRYSVGFNLYDHRSFVTKYLNLSGSINQHYVGEELGNIWGMRVDRYYDISDFDLAKAKSNLWVLNEGVTAIQGTVVKPGDIMFKDLNGDGTITGGAETLKDHGDLDIIGNTTSRYQFGFNLGLGYKGFDLSALLQGVGSKQAWLGERAMFPFGAGGSDGVFQPIFYNQTDYWTAKSYDPDDPDYMVANNPGARLFRIYGQEQNVGSNARKSDKYLQSAAYLRVKNVTLSYSFSPTLINKIALSGLRLYVSVENLATFSSLPKGYDPESLSWSYPFYRTWSIGASITL